MHWLVEMARRAGWKEAESLNLDVDVPTPEVWAVVARALGLTAEALAEHVAGWLHFDVAVPEQATERALRLVPLELARRYRAFPLRDNSRELVFATYEPLDLDAEQALSFASGRRSVFEVATPEVVERLLDTAYTVEATATDKLVARLDGELARMWLLEEAAVEPERLEHRHDSPVIRLMKRVSTGVAEGARDAERRGKADQRVEHRGPAEEGDGRDVGAEYARLFLADVPSLLGEIEAAVAAAEPERTCLPAHQFSRWASVFGAEELKEAAVRLERLGRAGALADMPAAVVAVAVACEQLSTVVADPAESTDRGAARCAA